MNYIKKNLFIEKVNATKIAAKYKTPIYCYSYNKLRKNISNLKSTFKSFKPLLCFSVKSNANIEILKEIGKLDCGADVVSLGELSMALRAGIKPKKIVFSGIGKTSNEIKFAIEKKILLINAESKSEILEIERISKNKKKKVDVGIRLNPNTDAKTLKMISTGKEENKFGVTENIFLELVDYVNNSQYLNLKCLSVHIGSQILDSRPYKKMLNVLKRVIKKSNHKFEYIDLGGGMGIQYNNEKKLNYNDYKREINFFLKNHKSKIIFEPGRSIIADTAVLISKIIYIKKTKIKNFIILDAGMNDFMRPALYGAKHKIIPLIKNQKKLKKLVEFVGPICETTDRFLSIKGFQNLAEKDLVAICDVGAYGMSLASNYNLRPKPIELLVKGNQMRVIKKKQKLSDIF
tara:strand:- start:9607 stop:10818 length:1212 start_codon:yes stop_codon:yes gene_type:complete